LKHFSPKQVAQRLGVSESSVKRWLDQGAVPILRTAGGHRRISQESLDKLIEQLRAPAALPRLDDVARAEDVAVAAGQGLSETTIDEISAAFRIALAEGRQSACSRLLQELIHRGFSPAAAADLLITPAMYGVGRQWQSGELAIYQERRACGVAFNLIHDLKRQLLVAADGPVAIGGTPEGDEYQLPTALIELALIENGWRATSLGCNLPMSEFRSAVPEYNPKVVWVSISWLEDEDKFVREFNATAEALPRQTALLIGGQAATDSLRPRLRYTGHGDTLNHLVELACSLTGRR
jgi:MerR family transcriptional regulator, light-induced transcriptional regulator